MELVRKVLFVPSPGGEWTRAFFPSSSVAELPVAGRRLIDYSIEHAVQTGIEGIRVIDHFGSKALADEFSDVERKGYKVEYELSAEKLPEGLEELAQSIFPGGVPEDTAIAWGPCITSHSRKETRLVPLDEVKCRHTPIGHYLMRGGRWHAILPHGVSIPGVQAWHKVNFAVLHDSRIFTLPGYSAEKGVHLGRNVVMEHGTEVKAPVILQDDTWCARLVRLDGDVIVGRGSYISEGVRLKRTIIGNDTYVGLGLDLEDKIVIGRRIIDAKTGEWTDVEEPGLVRPIPGSLRAIARSIIMAIWHFLIGSSHGGRR